MSTEELLKASYDKLHASITTKYNETLEERALVIFANNGITKELFMKIQGEIEIAHKEIAEDMDKLYNDRVDKMLADLKTDEKIQDVEIVEPVVKED